MYIYEKETALGVSCTNGSKQTFFQVVCLLMFLLTIPFPLYAQYTGRVFEDRNWNGVYDKGDKLLPKVAVSDGLHVVQTDAKGTYLLPGHERMRFLFITTPSG